MSKKSGRCIVKLIYHRPLKCARCKTKENCSQQERDIFSLVKKHDPNIKLSFRYDKKSTCITDFSEVLHGGDIKVVDHYFEVFRSDGSKEISTLFVDTKKSTEKPDVSSYIR